MPELNRFLYTSVGGDWYWIDRLAWSYSQWLEYLNRPELETWVGYLSGTVAGYFELEKQEDRNIEIAYFGLLGPFLGRNWGALLTAAVKRAWQMGHPEFGSIPARWMASCLKNYQARGFVLFKEEKDWKTLPDRLRPLAWCKRSLNRRMILF
jgi:hypothetical protein